MPKNNILVNKKRKQTINRRNVFSSDKKGKIFRIVRNELIEDCLEGDKRAISDNNHECLQD